MSRAEAEKLVGSLYEDKWLDLNECATLSGIKRRILKERCDAKLIEHQNYGGRNGIKVQWRNLKSYMRAHRIASLEELV